MHSGPMLARRGLAAALALGVAAGLAPRPASAQDAHGNGDIVIAIHGGAGTIRRGDMTPELEQAYRAKLEEALRAGYAILEKGGTSLDAVVAAIVVMEDSPLFNAGKGAVFTSEGKNELDAAIMDGATLRAGAVAGVTRVKNPIRLARAVMEHSPHVMLAGAGAEAFAGEQGLELVDPSYFFTQHRWDALQRAKAEAAGTPVSRPDGPQAFFPDDRKFGTVGAVALDRHGNLAAGTSTGGMTTKRWGRIGDSPIIGAGTYANNASCAVSATGHGEYFIRNVVAHDICARVEYGGQTLEEAANYVV
ncbi:MAG TPA: isoaspartyl peptidase/L-asparaginase, partial [Longimicrobiales bacterium]